MSIFRNFALVFLILVHYYFQVSFNLKVKVLIGKGLNKNIPAKFLLVFNNFVYCFLQRTLLLTEQFRQFFFQTRKVNSSNAP